MKLLAIAGVAFLGWWIAMPVLFTAFLAIFEFGFLALVIENGAHAVDEGAREGAKLWGSSVAFDNNVAGNYDPTGNDDIADHDIADHDIADHDIADHDGSVDDQTRDDV